MPTYIAYNIGQIVAPTLFLWIPILLTISALKRFYVLNYPIALWKSFSVTYIFVFLISYYKIIPFNIFVEYIVYFLLLAIVFWSSSLFKTKINTDNTSVSSSIQVPGSEIEKADKLAKINKPTVTTIKSISMSDKVKINIVLLLLLFATTCYFLKTIETQERIITAYQTQQHELKTSKDLYEIYKALGKQPVQNIKYGQAIIAKQTIKELYRYMFVIDAFWLILIFINYKSFNKTH